MSRIVSPPSSVVPLEDGVVVVDEVGAAAAAPAVALAEPGEAGGAGAHGAQAVQDEHIARRAAGARYKVALHEADKQANFRIE